MKVSAIIPTFNRSHTLNRAIDSVLKQTFKDFELIIVDDGSTDSTEQLVKSYEDPRLRYFKIKNTGVSGARNFGVKESKGEWLAFLDSDDEWHPKKLSLQLDYLTSNEETNLVHGEEIWIRRGKRVNQKKIHKKSGGDIFKRCLELCLISPSAVMLSRRLLDEMGGFDESYEVCEDYDLWLKITSKYEVGFISDPIITKYGGHEDQLSAKYFAMDFWRVRSMVNLLENHDLNLENKQATLNEILKKAGVLLAGYEKHNNMGNHACVLAWYNQAKELLNNLR